MSPRRKILALIASMTVLAALTWTLVGGMSVAQGQEKPIVIKRAHAGSYRPSFDRPIFILALGSDQGAPRYNRGGSVQRGRADAIQIIAINPTLKKATVLGIPRDSYVGTACSGRTKINAAMFFGGPDCVVRTVESMSGGRIRFDYYMVGSFSHLENAVDALGGVPVNVEPGVRGTLQDTAAKARGIRPGPQTLNGFKALAYTRDRKDYGRGDFARTSHQGQVIVGGLVKARQLVATDPGKTLLFLRTMFANMKSDIPLIEAFRLGLVTLQIDPKNVTNTFLDGTTGNTPAGSSVILSNPGRVLANLADNAILD